uniref:C2H2-type domain-containing protein n=1 Tax=Leptobrachium leishanense TaxID=445787 RepID=A0A8C5PN62_9ANUR
MNKDKARDPLTQRLLDLTLEIIFLLTGEGHIVVKVHETVMAAVSDQVSKGGSRRTQIFNTEPLTHSGIHEPNNEKILELSNQIIRLLTGEVPIRCEDVTVYLSMEEWEYVERHKELYEDIMMEDHQPVISIDKSVSGESITPASLSGNKSITNNMEQNLNKKTKGRAESATYTEQESPASGEEQVTNKSEYSPTDIKQEPASCAENLTDCVIYKPTENTSTDTGAESDSHGERNITDHDIFPSTEHTQTEYLSTDIKQESPIYKGNLTDSVIYKRTEYTPDNFGEYLTGDTNPLEINHSESLIESRKPDTDLIMYNSVYKDNAVISSEMGEVSYFESDLVIRGNNCRAEAFSPTFCRENPTPESGLKHQQVNIEELFFFPECGEHFTDRIALKRHQMIHTSKKTFNCTDCGNCFTRASHLAKHKVTHKAKKTFKCTDCGKCFTRASHLVKHKVTHKPKMTFKCTDCGKCFTRASHLVKHKVTHKTKKTFKCTDCGKCFTRASHLVKHKVTHKAKKTFKCTDCGKCFTCASSLAKHKWIHNKEKGIDCPDCGKFFVDASRLARHKLSHHSGEKPFKCTEYRKCFSETSNLAAKKIHTGEKTFKCPECKKCFSHASNLSKHKRIHSGEKTFKCPECKKCFSHASNLSKHKKIHPRDRPFKCTECGISFSSATILTQHKRIHTGEKPFKCTECGRCFSNSGSLSQHKIIHSGEKPFKCSECGIAFSRAKILVEHKLIHTGEKPFQCPECEKCYRQVSNLSRHARTHRGGNLLNALSVGNVSVSPQNLQHIKGFTKEKSLFKSPKCGQYFTITSSLASHKRTQQLIERSQ